MLRELDIRGRDFNIISGVRVPEIDWKIYDNDFSQILREPTTEGFRKHGGNDVTAALSFTSIAKPLTAYILPTSLSMLVCS